ncbi:MAG: hypothetical protein LBP65_00315 [Puniceicoccales bacterium]|jgi:hypothetical protein|nr:hypothetical protein [Puniceicoccales bacterium]
MNLLAEDCLKNAYQVVRAQVPSQQNVTQKSLATVVQSMSVCKYALLLDQIRHGCGCLPSALIFLLFHPSFWRSQKVIDEWGKKLENIHKEQPEIAPSSSLSSQNETGSSQWTESELSSSPTIADQVKEEPKEVPTVTTIKMDGEPVVTQMETPQVEEESETSSPEKWLTERQVSRLNQLELPTAEKIPQKGKIQQPLPDNASQLPSQLRDLISAFAIYDPAYDAYDDLKFFSEEKVNEDQDNPMPLSEFQRTLQFKNINDSAYIETDPSRSLYNEDVRTSCTDAPKQGTDINSVGCAAITAHPVASLSLRRVVLKPVLDCMCDNEIHAICDLSQGSEKTDSSEIKRAENDQTYFSPYFMQNHTVAKSGRVTYIQKNHVGPMQPDSEPKDQYPDFEDFNEWRVLDEEGNVVQAPQDMVPNEPAKMVPVWDRLKPVASQEASEARTGREENVVQAPQVQDARYSEGMLQWDGSQRKKIFSEVGFDIGPNFGIQKPFFKKEYVVGIVNMYPENKKDEQVQEYWTKAALNGATTCNYRRNQQDHEIGYMRRICDDSRKDPIEISFIWKTCADLLLLAKGGMALIHCMAGYARSATFVVCYNVFVVAWLALRLKCPIVCDWEKQKQICVDGALNLAWVVRCALFTGRHCRSGFISVKLQFQQLARFAETVAKDLPAYISTAGATA